MGQTRLKLTLVIYSCVTLVARFSYILSPQDTCSGHAQICDASSKLCGQIIVPNYRTEPPSDCKVSDFHELKKNLCICFPVRSWT